MTEYVQADKKSTIKARVNYETKSNKKAEAEGEKTAETEVRKIYKPISMPFSEPASAPVPEPVSEFNSVPDSDTVLKTGTETSPIIEAPPIKEVKFFSDPKAVKKKTQGSIVAFQIIFVTLFCLAYKLAKVFTPELYINVSSYLEQLFGW